MRASVFAVGLTLLIGFNALLHAQSMPHKDLAGSHDSPVVSRFAGSVISGYQHSDFDAVTMPLGPLKGGNFSNSDNAQGEVTQIAYVAPAGKSTLEVYHNFETSLQQAGFVPRFTCAGEACGDPADFSERQFQGLLDTMHGRNVMARALYANSRDIYQLTTRLQRADGNIDVSVMVSRYGDDAPVGVLLQIVQAKPMNSGEVTVDAKAMGDGLAQAGHIALYGIHFANDSATLSADSDSTLAQMAKLLQSQPNLKVYIVGHTDNTGALAHNLSLSQARAESVVKALSTRYGIAAARLQAKGVASYAPVASNHDEAGKAKNRRVELVEQ